MWVRHIILALAALVSGTAVAAGTFAFILVIGVVPRMLRKTNLAKRATTIENAIILGGLCGSAVSVLPALSFFGMERWGNTLWAASAVFLGRLLLVVYGISAGIFVGSISIALAEILNTFPIVFRRFHIKRGLAWVIGCVAVGKMCGAFFYFMGNYGG